MTINDVKNNVKIEDMAVINLTSEEFADRIEEMLDLASKGDNVLIHHGRGKPILLFLISDEELEDLARKKKHY